MSAQGWGYSFEPFELTMAGDALEAEVRNGGLGGGGDSEKR